MAGAYTSETDGTAEALLNSPSDGPSRGQAAVQPEDAEGKAREHRPGGERHIPVLLDPVLEVLDPLFATHAPVRILDATLGLGGHTEALLARHKNAHVTGLDRDEEALGLARMRLSPFGDRFSGHHGRFSDFARVLEKAGLKVLDGALIDIGVSSMQLDEARRGFSVHADGPLDMRMDQAGGAGRTAADLANSLSRDELRELIATLGEDPMAGRIASAIVEARAKEPITTTCRLADIVAHAYPASMRAKSRHHPATRTFQALRMSVNDELGELEAFLNGILGCLRPGGRLCVITFHSLEDRLVKRTMKRWASGCLCPPHAQTCTCGHVPEVRILLKKPVTASGGELRRNPRASSAKLRACEKL